MEFIILNTGGKRNVPIKAWVNGVSVEGLAQKQLYNIASMTDVVGPHIAVMPDVHVGKGATVGSVIPTIRALIPSAVGVDIGCGMLALRLNIKSEDLFDLPGLRNTIEERVPVGFSQYSEDALPNLTNVVWGPLQTRLRNISDRLRNKRGGLPSMDRAQCQLGTLGGGNHFIELCEDQDNGLWVMLHSGSRNIGNKIGQHFIGLARRDMERMGVSLPDKDLAYLREGSEYYDDYVEAVQWAQDYALRNREIMLAEVMSAIQEHFRRKKRDVVGLDEVVQCHHNYISRETHFGEEMWITRKGAVRARAGERVIIPGSMGSRSYIAQGRGNAESFESCSHGAGRRMSRGEAKRTFTLKDLRSQTQGVECRKDGGVIDEIPGAYKDIDAVMAAQQSLVEPLFTLKQVLCVKG
jgi:tRNA-splicing ligase RtcB